MAPARRRSCARTRLPRPLAITGGRATREYLQLRRGHDDVPRGTKPAVTGGRPFCESARNAREPACCSAVRVSQKWQIHMTASVPSGSLVISPGGALVPGSGAKAIANASSAACLSGWTAAPRGPLSASRPRRRQAATAQGTVGSSAQWALAMVPGTVGSMRGGDEHRRQEERPQPVGSIRGARQRSWAGLQREES